ncbi:MAG: hypothetical protein FWD57_09025, partial [Polyangiaceae bacterium]|nr:hypothetical protein [Polyangiaceae bacterium]
MSKVRVFDVARNLKMEPDQLVGLLQDLGFNDVRNRMSKVNDDAVERVRRHIEAQQSVPEVVEERLSATVVKRRRVGAPTRQAPPESSPSRSTGHSAGHSAGHIPSNDAPSSRQQAAPVQPERRLNTPLPTSDPVPNESVSAPVPTEPDTPAQVQTPIPADPAESVVGEATQEVQLSKQADAISQPTAESQSSREIAPNPPDARLAVATSIQPDTGSPTPPAAENNAAHHSDPVSSPPAPHASEPAANQTIGHPASDVPLDAATTSKPATDHALITEMCTRDTSVTSSADESQPTKHVDVEPQVPLTPQETATVRGSGDAKARDRDIDRMSEGDSPANPAAAKTPAAADSAATKSDEDRHFVPAVAPDNPRDNATVAEPVGSHHGVSPIENVAAAPRQTDDVVVQPQQTEKDLIAARGDDGPGSAGIADSDSVESRPAGSSEPRDVSDKPIVADAVTQTITQTVAESSEKPTAHVAAEDTGSAILGDRASVGLNTPTSAVESGAGDTVRAAAIPTQPQVVESQNSPIVVLPIAEPTPERTQTANPEPTLEPPRVRTPEPIKATAPEPAPHVVEPQMDAAVAAWLAGESLEGSPAPRPSSVTSTPYASRLSIEMEDYRPKRDSAADSHGTSSAVGDTPVRLGARLDRNADRTPGQADRIKRGLESV